MDNCNLEQSMLVSKMDQKKTVLEEDPKENGAVFKLDNYLTFNIKIMKLATMWPFEGFGKRVLPTVAFLLHSLGIHISMSHIICVLAMDTTNQWTGDLADVAFKIANVIAYLTGHLTLLFFQIRMPALTSYTRNLNKTLRTRSAVGLDYMTLEHSYRLGRKYSMIWTTIVIAGCQHLSIYPILVQERILPMGSSYLYDTTPSPVYELTFLWQAYCQFLIAIIYVVLGIYYMTVLIMLCGQYDILFCSLKNVYNTARLAKGVSRLELRKMQEEYEREEPEPNEYFSATPLTEDLSSYPNGFEAIIPESLTDKSSQEEIREKIMSFDLKSVSQYFNGKTSSNNFNKENDAKSTELDKYLSGALIDCVNHHLVILDYCKQFKILFSPMLFIKALQISSFLGVCAYSASGSKQDTMQIVNIVDYLVLSTSDLMILCYFGHQLFYQSDRVRLALLRAPWNLFGASVRRSVNIILEASSRPIVLTGGGFYNMNLQQFRSLLSASFSYFTLLRNMQEDE